MIQLLAVYHVLKFKYMSEAVLNIATGIIVSISKDGIYKTNILSLIVC